MWDSRNFKKYGAFGESAYSITQHHSGESGNSDESSDTGDLGNIEIYEYIHNKILISGDSCDSGKSGDFGKPGDSGDSGGS